MRLIAKTITAIACALLVLSGSAQDPLKPVLNGEFVGFQRLSNLAAEEGATAEEKSDKWFHQNMLLIRNNEAILDMIPIYFRHGKKFYSASDGGFLTYRGQFFEQNGRLMISLRLFRSDYVMFPAGKDPYRETRIYGVTKSRGGIEFNGVRYKPATLPAYKTKDLLGFMKREPLNKP